MQSNIPCSCQDTSRCGGKLTETELTMNKMDPSQTPQQYHQIMALFEAAFDVVHGEGPK